MKVGRRVGVLDGEFVGKGATVATEGGWGDMIAAYGEFPGRLHAWVAIASNKMPVSNFFMEKTITGRRSDVK